MSRSERKRSKLELGHDAFLDIVANLVGILIILVVVLGSQSTAVIEEIQAKTKERSNQVAPESSEPLASDQQMSELLQYSMRAAAAQRDSNRLEKTIKQYDARIEFRNRQRAGLLDLLAKAEEAWQRKQQELDQRDTELARRNSEFNAVTKKLAELKGERMRLENQPEEVVAVTHLPTPMARTVFGEELHFRLKNNLLSVVPIEKLVDEVRRDVRRSISGSRTGVAEASVGPVRGYIAHYSMAKGQELISQDGRVAMATRVNVLGMTFKPLREPHGQPIEQVLAERRDLDIELAGRDPGSTAITVWVYPDSFASLRRLKEYLYSKGFATAARPLEVGRDITASPNGTRSQAQ
ncbi:MAG: hypothetical protein MI861_29070 [Pirellulales bacterium]|nr:hypothetical protein [Pirellulales bacterium]